MDRSSELEFRTTPAPASASATSASCSNPSEYCSARRESTGMGKSGVRRGRPRSIDEQIELSKSHWSQLADFVCSSTYDEGQPTTWQRLRSCNAIPPGAPSSAHSIMKLK